MPYPCFIILADACFSYDIPCYLAFDPTFACCRELENLALRHQIGVLQRPAAKRLKLTKQVLSQALHAQLWFEFDSLDSNNKIKKSKVLHLV